MASNFVATGAGDKDHHHIHHHHPVSPKNSFKKTNQQPPTPSCGHGHHQMGGAVPKCVCAPPTHAGSFKCRLHRVNSQGHSAPSAPAPNAPASSTRTVEAL
uniref:Aryl hydrocarbon receptor nuclear translocator n=1 Tax=Anthurium amnicola TaxID=1678845 RepID=A0A1D1XQJ8_9ARAE